MRAKQEAFRAIELLAKDLLCFDGVGLRNRQAATATDFIREHNCDKFKIPELSRATCEYAGRNSCCCSDDE